MAALKKDESKTPSINCRGKMRIQDLGNNLRKNSGPRKKSWSIFVFVGERG